VNRRAFLAGTGTVAVGALGTVGARLTNHRWYDPDPTTDPSLPPSERVFEADRSLSVLDHRAVTTVTVLEDGADRTPYRRARYRYEHERSRHRYRRVYSTFALPEGAPPPVIETVHAQRHAVEVRNAAEADDEDLPVTTLVFFSPGVTVYDPRAETPSGPDERPRVDDGRRTVSRGDGLGRRSDDRPNRRTFVLSPDAEWEVIESGDGTERFETRSRDDYASAVPLATTVDVEPGSSIVATLDADTGRLLALDDHRVVEQVEQGPRGPEGGETRTFSYRVRTRFDYENVRARMPGGPVPEASPAQRARELWTELLMY